MFKRLLIATAATALLLTPAAPAQAAKKPVKYAGKTKEGTKISFSVTKKGWIENFKSSVPTSCVSAQGGNPHVTISNWAPPYNFKLGRKAKVVAKDPYPTTTYKISTRKGKRGAVSGHIELSYSRLVNNTFAGYHIDTCFGTGNFKLRPKR